MVAGSSLWQTIFLSFALILIAFEIVRGWRLGVVRQLVRLLAIVSAYVAAIFGGRMLLPLLRPFARVPDLVISLGEIVKDVDVVPAKTYQTLGKLGTVVSNPQSAARFLSYPGAKQLSENPKIIALRGDREIIELIEQKRFVDLLHHPHFIEAMN